MTRPKARALVTPDGRYLIVRGRLWRATNQNLSATTRDRAVKALMQARRDVGASLRTGDRAAEADARRRVNAAKVTLGERGPVWWDPEEGDYNQHMAINSPYADWFTSHAGGSEMKHAG